MSNSGTFSQAKGPYLWTPCGLIPPPSGKCRYVDAGGAAPCVPTVRQNVSEESYVTTDVPGPVLVRTATLLRRGTGVPANE